MPLQWRNQIWQSLEEGAGKRCSESALSLDNRAAHLSALISPPLQSLTPTCSTRRKILASVGEDPATAARLRLVGWLKYCFTSTATVGLSSLQIKLKIPPKRVKYLATSSSILIFISSSSTGELSARSQSEAMFVE